MIPKDIQTRFSSQSCNTCRFARQPSTSIERRASNTTNTYSLPSGHWHSFDCQSYTSHCVALCSAAGRDSGFLVAVVTAAAVHTGTAAYAADYAHDLVEAKAHDHMACAAVVRRVTS